MQDDTDVKRLSGVPGKMQVDDHDLPQEEDRLAMPEPVVSCA